VIDFHCHIDLFPDPVSLISELDSLGIYVLAVTTTPKSWNHLQTLLAGRRRIKGAIGLHPELVAERFHEVDEVCSILSDTPYVGEIGLDGSPHFRSSFKLQQQVFERILKRCTEVGGRIMSIHSRAATSAVLNLLQIYAGAGTPVLHWFSGTEQELERAIKIGCWFSVGPTMLETTKGRRLVAAMPKSRVLTESDGPFAQMSGVSVTPTQMILAEELLGEIWDMSSDEIKTTLHKNLKILVQSAKAR